MVTSLQAFLMWVRRHCMRVSRTASLRPVPLKVEIFLDQTNLLLLCRTLVYVTSFLYKYTNCTRFILILNLSWSVYCSQPAVCKLILSFLKLLCRRCLTERKRSDFWALWRNYIQIRAGLTHLQAAVASRAKTWSQTGQKQLRAKAAILLCCSSCALLLLKCVVVCTKATNDGSCLFGIQAETYLQTTFAAFARHGSA